MDPEEDHIILDPLSVPPEFVKEGTDWLAVFNPTVPRVMDVDLAHKFVHDKYVFIHYIYCIFYIFRP
jgi:hypothetical protein